MKTSLSIQLKAAFLLIVFSLNIVVGFACSVGIDMGFNSHHHDGEMMAMSSAHHHDEMSKSGSETDNDDCCKDKVTKLTTSDKSLPQSYNAIVNPVFFASFISTFYQVHMLPVDAENRSNKIFARSSPPAIPDIRIAIQSFLI